ncbi:MAG: substrate-binding domain-containing protein [Nonlabens sp.]|nr:substrate-binding domain-containing protein [Nonlabens sp.]
MNRFQDDLKQEVVLASYLDSLYDSKGLRTERVTDSTRQHQGIDLLIHAKGTTYMIDEKAQLHYLNADLKTFTFELSYLKNNVLKTGWLFDEHKSTQYYFLITGIYLKKGLLELHAATDIDNLKITSVNRHLLIGHLAELGLDKERLKDYEQDLRSSKSFGKNYIAELDSKIQGVLFYTEHLAEQPINIQLRLEYLLEQKIAKRFH